MAKQILGKVRGADGVTPNLQVGTVTTLPSDRDATVIRDPLSPDSDPVFHFGIPKGEAAEKPGDMQSAIYDPQGKKQDIYSYFDQPGTSWPKEDEASAGTKAKYGLGPGAKPDEILSALSKTVLQTPVAGKQILSSFTWPEINEVANAGLAEEWFLLGERKEVLLTTGQTITMQIVGFNHDDLASGTGKAAISFVMTSALTTTYNMNATNTNVGGWESCAMRGRMQGLLEQMPLELRGLIKPVLKKTTAGNKLTTIVTTTDSLWLPSAIELGRYGAAAGYKDEGTCYPGAAETGYGWFRSPYLTDSISFVVGSNAQDTFSNASVLNSIRYGFCIGDKTIGSNNLPPKKQTGADLVDVLGNAVFSKWLAPVTGTYLGTGISVTQTITLGFRPSAVLVMSNGGSISGGNNTDYGLALGNQDGKILKLTAAGFTVTSEGLNIYPGTGQSYITDKNPYRYIAWR